MAAFNLAERDAFLEELRLSFSLTTFQLVLYVPSMLASAGNITTDDVGTMQGSADVTWTT